MDFLLITLEYIVFTLPIFIGLGLSFRWYIQKRTYERMLYLVAFILPLVSTLSLIKIFYILELGPKESAFLPINFIFALGISIFVYITVYFTTGRELSIPNAIETAGVILLIFTSLFLKNISRTLDYIFWGLIGISIIHLARGFAYSKYGTQKEKIEYVLIIAFSGISILLKLLYYLGLIYLKPTIYISLILMFFAFLHAVFAMRNVGSKMPSRSLPKEVFQTKISIFRRLVIISVLATLLTSTSAFLGYLSFKNQKEVAISNFNAKVEQAVFNINNALKNYIMDLFENHLTYLAETLELDNPTKAQQQIKTFYETHKNVFASVTLMNNSGIIVYTYPYTYSIGENISSQPHVKEVLDTKRVTLSEPFKAVQGFYALALHIPLFKDNTFYGTVVGLIDLKTLSQELSNIAKSQTFIVSEDGIVLCSNVSQDIFLENMEGILVKIKRENSVVRSYSFTYLHRNFEIYVFGNLSQIEPELNSVFINIVVTYGIFILLFTILYGILLFGLFETEKEATGELEEALRKEVEALKAYKFTQEKLNTLNEFIYSTSIEEPVEKFTTHFLEVVMELVPKVEKGVLWIAVEDKVIPAGSIGYDTEILKNLVLERYREEKLWHTPSIVKNIGVSGFPPQLQQYAKQLGLEEIKETLMIPIISEGHYVGHLSLDILKEGVHFDSEDVKLAKSVSKVISFYISMQAAFNALKKEIDLNSLLASNLETIINFISATTFREIDKEFFSKLLDLSLSLIEGGEKGTVLLRRGEELQYVASVGFNLELLNQLKIDVETEEKLVEKGKVKIIESIGTVGLSEEQQKLAIKIGLDQIKFTITASFFIDEEYWGGIFIDSSKDYNPFTNKDVETMKAISNLGSLFLRTRKLFEDLENEIKVDTIVRQISEHLNFDLEIKNFLKEVFRLIELTFENVEYMKVSIKLENKFIHLFACKEGIEFERNSLEGYAFDSEKKYKNLEIVNYIVDKDRIEIGILPESFKETEVLTQLELAILPSIKSFFIYKDRAKLFGDVMIAFARAIDSKDPYTRMHSENVTKYGYFFGKNLNLDEANLRVLVLSSILHDVGKIGVNDVIIQKNGPLTYEERLQVQVHPTNSYKIVSAIEGLSEESIVIRHHHERWDGTGYPDGLKNGGIPFLSRILTIVDAFDAMTTDRPYRKALSVDEAMKEILNNAGTQFDPELANKFASLKGKIKEALNIPIEKILQEVLNIE